MALTPEQQAQIDFEEARESFRRQFEDDRESSRRQHEQQMESLRHTNALILYKAQADAQAELQVSSAESNASYQSKQIKLEAIRLAKETLIENARSKPVDSRDISSADVQAFAQSLVNYING